jgi:hypothetical protein
MIATLQRWSAKLDRGMQWTGKWIALPFFIVGFLLQLLGWHV